MWLVFQVSNGLSNSLLPPRQSASPLSGLPEEAWWIGLVPLVVASWIRWKLLPPKAGTIQGFTLLIIGAALCEQTLLIGHFLFPSDYQKLAILSAMGLGHFVPVYLFRLKPF
jgi:hypothetical protein